MRRLSIQWRVTLWFTLLMTLLAAVGLGFLFFMGGQSALAATKGPHGDHGRELPRGDRPGASTAWCLTATWNTSGTGSTCRCTTTPVCRSTARCPSGLTIPSSLRTASCGRSPTRAAGGICTTSATRWATTRSGCARWRRWMRSDSTITTLLRLAVIVLPLLCGIGGGGGISAHRPAPSPRCGASPRPPVRSARGAICPGAIALGPGRDEIHTLADEFDHMFARLEASLCGGKAVCQRCLP